MWGPNPSLPGRSWALGSPPDVTACAAGVRGISAFRTHLSVGVSYSSDDRRRSAGSVLIRRKLLRVQLLLQWVYGSRALRRLRVITLVEPLTFSH